MSLQRSTQQSGLPGWFWRALAFAFLGTLIVAGYMVYARVRDYVASQQVVTFTDSEPTLVATSISDATPIPIPEVPQWAGHGRVNVLLLGVDEREGEEGPWRTDTLLLLTLDPVTMSAGMLSIPRDLWVTIPGYDEHNRINTAHYFGDAYAYPGGGPALARDTVTWILGVPIHFYARVNFTAFESVIDEIGGIDIFVPEAIDDPYYPDEGYGYDPFHVEAGNQHMDGRIALKYARTRATFGGDFDRGRRQQEVVLAVRDQVVNLGKLPKLISRAPALMASLGDAIRTDMRLEQALQLAQLAAETDRDQIVTAILDHNYTSFRETPDGAQVLVANQEAVRELRSLLFGEPKVAGAGLTDAERMVEESARIIVLNGSTEPGLARSTSDYLSELGFQVVGIGDASSLYENTLIIDHTGKRYTSKHLAGMLDMPLSRVVSGNKPEDDYDLTLILGGDFELPER